MQLGFLLDANDLQVGRLSYWVFFSTQTTFR